MRRRHLLLTLPALLASACTTVAPSESTPAQTMPSDSPPRYIANVMAVQWVSPLSFQDYGADWNLLRHLGMATPNANDDGHPERWPLGTPVVPIATTYRSSKRYISIEQDIDTAITPFGRELIFSPSSFYSLGTRYHRFTFIDQQSFLATSPRLLGEPLNDQYWHRFRIGPTDTPANEALTAADMAREPVAIPVSIERLVNEVISSTTDGWDEYFNPEHLQPSTTIDFGGRAAGFYSLARAQQYIASHPQKPAWLIGQDMVDFPTSAQPTENCTVLILASPDLKHPVPRKPLARLYRPFRVKLESSNGRPPGVRARVDALREAMRQAMTDGEVDFADIGKVFHDAGLNSDQASRSIGALGQALTEMGLEGSEFAERTYNVDTWLRDAGSAAAGMNFAFAIAYSHWANKPALVVATREDDEVFAVLVRPPEGHQTPEPVTEWPRARSGGLAYWPWWGRLDRKKPR
ncbi:DUF2875 family protein [Derxia gummosa]|uniref:DUF2875 family protein n=1 Tax=Derxia gummosa DSM 723 TaxID=1121388 RepID=A0A8B6XCJ9_9BURK|nr:DUF2875 family protein [Derxia gummosa]